MQAVRATAFGAPSVLAVTEVPTPEPGPGRMTVDVTHAAVGLVDVFLRQGLYKDRPGLPQAPFVPGLEVAGTVRALGDGVSGFAVGERVVSMSAAGGTGGYASVYLTDPALVVSLDGYDIDSALAVSVLPNAAMAHAAFTRVAHLAKGESVLVHGALGGFSAAFPGIAKQLGAARVVGTVRAGKLEAAARTRLPYDRIVDSAEMTEALAGETFDVVVDPVGGDVRTRSLDLMGPGGRLLVGGNASGDWDHSLRSNDLWYRSITVSGFNSGAYLPSHPDAIRPGLEAARAALAAGLGGTEIEILPFSRAAEAHERMENRSLDGRIVLVPDAAA
ncbi:quinone oxidoreductase family protein [Streptomyces fuscigenes]|uniref:quinone oxidoreductase family protein n=1 Tax=Streptomyces fuscigenes TaxID=1528880 RepID=UPI001F20FE4D|nr:zinc-binding dehydrogenase [Streptomyces fuscigenes]MCF3962643.1 zinc-binding dehydrogenase [Streptomyces fuscigenes]